MDLVAVFLRKDMGLPPYSMEKPPNMCTFNTGNFSSIILSPICLHASACFIALKYIYFNFIICVMVCQCNKLQQNCHSVTKTAFHDKILNHLVLLIKILFICFFKVFTFKVIFHCACVYIIHTCYIGTLGLVTVCFCTFINLSVIVN